MLVYLDGCLPTPAELDCIHQGTQHQGVILTGNEHDLLADHLCMHGRMTAPIDLWHHTLIIPYAKLLLMPSLAVPSTFPQAR